MTFGDVIACSRWIAAPFLCDIISCTIALQTREIFMHWCGIEYYTPWWSPTVCGLHKWGWGVIIAGWLTAPGSRVRKGSPYSSTPTAFPTLSPLTRIGLLPIELVRFQCFLTGLCFVFGLMDTLSTIIANAAILGLAVCSNSTTKKELLRCGLILKWLKKNLFKVLLERVQYDLFYFYPAAYPAS